MQVQDSYQIVRIALFRIISGESYFTVIKKCIDNIGHISGFLKEKMTF